MILRWLFFPAVRRAAELRQHVERLVNEQRDLLDAEAIGAITEAIDHLRHALKSNQSNDVLKQRMDELVAAAEKSLLPFPHGAARENVREFLVAATVILAITTFFVQLTKIPTGSMQPTLYGVTHSDWRNQPGKPIPNGWRRTWEYWVHGVSYYQEIARNDGDLRVERAEPLRLPLLGLPIPFVKRQRLFVGDDSRPYTVWFPPEKLVERAGLQNGRYIRKGEAILKLKTIAGDHLLVDRLSYNFRRPKRGEIFVFKTRGIDELGGEDQLYIKRLVALGGERVRIGNDHHLVVDGRRLDAATPHFENVYTFSGEPRSGGYFGHVNQAVANRYTNADLARNFLTETNEYHVRPKSYLAMGDNTLNSRDSRDWGELPQENVIGKCWFVYWPISARFGWGNR